MTFVYCGIRPPSNGLAAVVHGNWRYYTEIRPFSATFIKRQTTLSTHTVSCLWGCLPQSPASSVCAHVKHKFHHVCNRSCSGSMLTLVTLFCMMSIFILLGAWSRVAWILYMILMLLCVIGNLGSSLHEKIEREKRNRFLNGWKSGK